MRSKVCLTLLAALSFAASCAGPNDPPPSRDFCVVARPLQPDSLAVADLLVDQAPELSEALIRHNRLGEALCGWRF